MTTHGMKDTHEYWCWRDMKARCYKPRHPQFANYGGRGIRVCDRWLNSFEAFLEDMGLKPEGNRIGIGRIDNDGDYCPENCRWETQEQQQNNKRTSHYLTHDGVTLTVTQWARKLGMHPNTLFNRLCQGWSVEKALETAGDSNRHMFTHNGTTLSIRGWARKLGVTHSGITYRLKQGWSIERIIKHFSNQSS